MHGVVFNRTILSMGTQLLCQLFDSHVQFLFNWHVESILDRSPVCIQSRTRTRHATGIQIHILRIAIQWHHQHTIRTTTIDHSISHSLSHSNDGILRNTPTQKSHPIQWPRIVSDYHFQFHSGAILWIFERTTAISFGTPHRHDRMRIDTIVQFATHLSSHSNQIRSMDIGLYRIGPLSTPSRRNSRSEFGHSSRHTRGIVAHFVLFQTRLLSHQRKRHQENDLKIRDECGG